MADVVYVRGPADAFRGQVRQPEVCTTGSHRKRHLSLNLGFGRVSGRSGRTLCGRAAEDETRANYWRRHWHAEEISVEQLPSCPNCERSAARMRCEAS